jgi:hypothetical protein
MARHPMEDAGSSLTTMAKVLFNCWPHCHFTSETIISYEALCGFPLTPSIRCKWLLARIGSWPWSPNTVL